MDLAAVMRARRADLGMSQAALAQAAGVDKRQIRRYEAGEQQPVLSVAVAIADALGVSVGELAGVPSARLNLTGQWWASWQTYKDGTELVTTQQLRFRQQADVIQVDALTRGLDVAEGGYLWRGELRLWDNRILMGWYAANDDAVASKGTMYFVLHPHGQTASGRWVGLSYEGDLVTGWAGIAKTDQDSRAIVATLKQDRGQPA